jgi:hypothetical protein
MADLNQGASIEAERACLLVKELSRISMSLAADLVKGADYTFQGHDYLDRNFVCERVMQWRREWDATDAERTALLEAARRSVPPAAGELPPLRELIQCARDAVDDMREWMQTYGESSGTLKTIEKLEAAIAADSAQRKQAALQEIIDIGQEIEGGAAPNVKTWQERANELAVSGRPRGYPDTDEMDALKEAEIADLRAQLAWQLTDNGLLAIVIEQQKALQAQASDHIERLEASQLARQSPVRRIEPLKYGCGPHFEYIKGHNDALRAVYAGQEGEQPTNNKGESA